MALPATEMPWTSPGNSAWRKLGAAAEATSPGAWITLITGSAERHAGLEQARAKWKCCSFDAYMKLRNMVCDTIMRFEISNYLSTQVGGDCDIGRTLEATRVSMAAANLADSRVTPKFYDYVRSYTMCRLITKADAAEKDFGLMASLTYEPPSRVEEGCSHYFHGRWHVELKPPNVDDSDWARFVMFTSDNNSTTVIAVRGTLNALDVLHDVTLWLVPAVMQLCNYIGPDMSDGSWGISMSRLSNLIPLAPIRKQTTFDSVFLAVIYMMTKHPDRRSRASPVRGPGFPGSATSPRPPGCTT
eukprot:Skav221993  [mRNA]  locus=scaffold1319:114092:125535:- [translate_table: standard]